MTYYILVLFKRTIRLALQTSIMPIGLLGSAAIGLGSGLMSKGANAIYDKWNRDANQKFESDQAALQRQWNESMYDKQWDNETSWKLAQWHRENQYNSPVEQMARLKEAGINPHMAYAKGTLNNVAGGSPNPSAQVQGYDRAGAKSALKGLSDFNLLGAINQGAAVDQTKAQTELLRNQAITEVQNNLLRLEQTRAKAIENDRNTEVYDQMILQEYERLEGMREDNNRKRLDNKFLQSTLNTRIELQGQELVRQIEEVNRICSEIDLNRAKTLTEEQKKRIAEATANLNAMGFSWQDPWIQRSLAQGLKGNIPPIVYDEMKGKESKEKIKKGARDNRELREHVYGGKKQTLRD